MSHANAFDRVTSRRFYPHNTTDLCNYARRRVCSESVIGLFLQRECIARIDPKTGRVVGWINMIGLTADAFDKAKGQVSLPVFRSLA
jgi:hypothetical protein